MANTITRHIPNFITCCNLVSGCIATYFAFLGLFSHAFVAIVAGAVFDFFDGMSARLLGVSSPIGKELDSLADCVTFGVAPSAMLFTLLSVVDWPLLPGVVSSVVPFLAFAMAAFSALRLAKFNLDERQTTSFIGMPTPANTLFWASVITGAGDFVASSPLFAALAVVAMFCSCWLLVSEVPMFALKFKHWGWHGNELKYVFVAVSVPLLVLLGVLGVAAVMVLYVVLSVATCRREAQA